MFSHILYWKNIWVPHRHPVIIGLHYNGIAVYQEAENFS